jgi:hypothetical protein
MTPTTPTGSQFTAYEGMFVYFNTELFAGELPPCLLNFSRKARTNGFFAPERWENAAAGEVRHEISLNPTQLKTRPLIDVAATLVHEMVHLWQQENGKPSRTGYHNQEWAAKMEAVGLMPSTDGTPQGKRVGQSVTHYIVGGAPFEVAFRRMPEAIRLPWTCVPEDDSDGKKRTASRNKVKYACPCENNVWGKPGLSITCDECEEPFAEVEA